MRRSASPFGLALVAALTASSAASAVTITWAYVADAGNPADAATGYGTVGYVYEISKSEITNAQYTEFLNAVAATADANGLYDPNMGTSTSPFFGGITQTPVGGGGFTYATIAGRASKPVNWVSFYDALRFANWMFNGQPTGVQDATTTEGGSYTITPGGISSNTIARDPAATIVVPSEDEWYKAAYYTCAGSTSYFAYPTRSNAPTTCKAPAVTPNSGNCANAAGGTTDVGGYPNSLSAPFRTFDQGGNVWEWNEGLPGLAPFDRGIRGGAFNVGANNLASTAQNSFLATSASASVGFRVAKVGAGATGADADTDLDGIPDVLDKCALDSRNAVSTCDTDLDGFGNVCDGDFNGSLATNAIDLGTILADVADGVDAAGVGTDMNCSGAINATDYTMYFLPAFLVGKPGPSGKCCAGSPPCP